MEVYSSESSWDRNKFYSIVPDSANKKIVKKFSLSIGVDLIFSPYHVFRYKYTLVCKKI